MPDRSPADRNQRHPLSADGVCHWRCPNCGQHTFTTPQDTPPDKCDFCADLTTWEYIGTSSQGDDWAAE